MKKKLLIISFSYLDKDPRVFRQIEALHHGYDVTTLGFSSSDIEGVKHINCSPEITFGYRLKRRTFLMMKLFEKVYWNNTVVQECLEKTSKNDFDLIISNDIDTLPLALKIRGEAKVLFDAHEYFPKHFESSFKWRFLYQSYNNYLCEKYMGLADAITTVSNGIAEEYQQEFDVEKPIVVTNATNYIDLVPSTVYDDKIKIIHHGGAMEARRIEEMIQMMDYMDSRFYLDLMLVPHSHDYFNKLNRMAQERSNVKIIEPVPMKEIANYINIYDIGLYLCPPTSFNMKWSLPNKFFEYIQGRLMVAIGPSPEMDRISKEFKLGIVSESFGPSDLAEGLNQLSSKEIKRYKGNSHLAASELNSEANMEIYCNLLEKISK